MYIHVYKPSLSFSFLFSFFYCCCIFAFTFPFLLLLLLFLFLFLLLATVDPVMYPQEQTFSKEVDERANAYFQAIYNRGVSVDNLLDLLKQFKDSPNKKERVN